MNIKSSILILLLSISTLASACPGGKHRDGEQQQQRVNLLNLSDQQKSQFKEVMTHKREKMHEAMQSIQAETQAELASILDDEQMAQFKEQSEKRKARGRHRIY
jgi:Spy/CpxP family protein refolding chaperone